VRIKKIRLRNFLSHGNSSLDFDPSINVIIGNNGSGKSSILEAIYYALYGRTLRGRLKSVFRRSRGHPQREMEVELTFEIGGRYYSVLRRVVYSEPPKTVRCYLRDDLTGRILYEGSENVNEEINRLLGVSDKVFISSVFVQQGEIGTILERSPAERKQLFSKLIGISDIDQLYEQLHELWKSFRDKTENLDAMKKKLEDERKRKAQLEGEKRELEGRLREVSEKLREVVEALSEIKPKVEEGRKAKTRLDERMRVLQETIRELREKEEEMKRLSEELADLEGLEKRVSEKEGIKKKVDLVRKIIDIQKEIEENLNKRNKLLKLLDEISSLGRQVEEYESVRRERESLLEHLSELTGDIKLFRSRIQKLDNEIRMLEEELKKLPEGDLGEVSSLLEQIKEELDKLKNRKGVEEGKLRMLEEELKLLESAKGVCPTCGRPLDEAKRLELIEKKREEIGRINEELRRLESEIEQLNSKCRELEKLQSELQERSRILEELTEKRSELKDLTGKLEGFELSLEEAQKKREMLERRLEKLEEKRDRFTKLKGMLDELTSGKPPEEALREFEATEKVRQKEELIKEYLRSFGELPIFTDELLRELEEAFRKYMEDKDMLSRLKAKQGRLEELRRSAERLRTNVEVLNGEIRELQEKTRDLEDLEREYGELERQREDLDREKTRIEASLKRIEGELEWANKNIRDFEAQVKYMEKLKRAIGIIDEIKELLKGKIKERYNERVLSFLRGQLPRLLSKLALNFLDVELDGTLDLRLSTPEGSTVGFKELSGGEKVLVALAFRLALLQVLGGAGSSGLQEPLPLILDEPTTHLDDEHRAKVIEALREFYYKMVRGEIPQMIIVSHYKDFVEVAEKVFMVEKVGEVSRVSVQSAQQ